VLHPILYPISRRASGKPMTHVATLIARPDKPLPDDVERLAAANLPAAGAPVWLDPGLALDIPFTPPGDAGDRTMTEDPRAALHAALEGIPVDVVVQQAEGRRKRLLLADMDSTMIGQECIDELADFIGEKARVAAITERAMRGEIEFAPALRERVAVLAGLPAAAVDEVIAKRITLTPGGPALVRTMHRFGAYTCLVSGGFTVFTGKIAALIGFDENRGNSLIVGDDGRFAGTVAEPILGRDAKLETLRQLRAKLGLVRNDTLVVGDGANDLAMIGEAGLGVAFRAKPLVAQSAAARIDHGDLTALLFAQGYRRDEFVEWPAGHNATAG
jgi:phosphoserine phosphatase